MPADDAPSPELDIHLGDDVAEGVYANLAMIAHSSEEFILDFIRVVPGVAQARVKSRVLITPTHAKRLLRALEDNIRRYEAAHGAITGPTQPPRPMPYGGPGGEA
jgi:hypothetical protein